MSVKRAKRQMLRLAMALIGPSGSGKTVGALILAYGMMKEKYPELDEYDLWGKIGLIDAEHERALVYEGLTKGGVHIGQFWHKDLRAPFSVEAYTQAAIELKAEGVEVIIVDSLSHAWSGEGGVLDYHEVNAKKNKFSSWNDTNKESYHPLVAFAVGESTGVHMINTIRAKQTYAQQTDDNGTAQIVKLGVQPVQRDQLEYEFQIALNVDMDHKSQASKDNSDIFEGFYGELTPEHGSKLFQWLETGVDIFAERRAAAAKEEAERMVFVQELRQLEADHGLQETVKTVELHPSYANPLEKLPMAVLHQVKGLMRQEMAKRVAETKKLEAEGANQ